MAETPTINWHGQSGKAYKYWIHPIGTRFEAVPGNYIFATKTQPNNWSPVYIGESSNLQERLTDSHEALPCVKRNGGTHVHVHRNDAGQAARRAEEQDLIAKWKPPCNG